MSPEGAPFPYRTAPRKAACADKARARGGPSRAAGAVFYGDSSRSSVAWQAAHTQVRSSVMRWGSRLSVHGNSFFAPQRGQTSVG
jgi:hypothetical protein